MYAGGNKKVLLRECKRHTDRGVSSTPSVILYEVGYLPPRGTPHQVRPGGVPKVVYPLSGYPPRPGLDRQNDGLTRVKTLPSRRTTYAVGNKNMFKAKNKSKLVSVNLIVSTLSHYLVTAGCIMKQDSLFSLNVNNPLANRPHDAVGPESDSSREWI